LSLQDAVVDHIFELLLEFFSVHAHSIAFPEIALPAVVRVSTYSQYMVISITSFNLIFYMGIFIVVNRPLLTAYGPYGGVRTQSVPKMCLLMFVIDVHFCIGLEHPVFV